MSYNVVLWGLGKNYRIYRNYLKSLENTGVIHVCGVFSVDNIEVSEIDGWHYYVYEDIPNVAFDYLLVLNETHEQAIIDDLLEANVEREKIIPGRILELPNFDFERYIQLKESRVSIISRTCMGGMLSQAVGLEYLSPFRNIEIEEEDFIKLLNDFEEYMKCDLVYSGERLFSANTLKYYPVMNLNDIRIKFPHIRGGRHHRQFLIGIEGRRKLIDQIFLLLISRKEKILRNNFRKFRLSIRRVLQISGAIYRTQYFFRLAEHGRV